MASHCFRPHQAWIQPVAGKPCSPELRARLRLEEGVSLEVRLRLGLGLELRQRHSCEGNGLRKITGSSTTKREIMAFSSS